MYQKYFKRLFDIILSLILIIILFPIMIITFFITWYSIGYPFFFQKRPGLNHKIFTLYKFKTLYDDTGKISEKKRQNKVGKFFRRTGLDELPQLFNVLENNMSLIGPRPLLVEYLKRYSAKEKKRHMIKPGITGLAQVTLSGSGRKSWAKSFKLDLYYVENVSFFLDIRILIRTIKVILLKKKQYDDFEKLYE